MPSVFIDSDLRRFYEVPDVPHAIVDVGGGLRRYTPNDIGAAPIITRYDLVADVYSPWVRHRDEDDADYATLAFNRSGGAVIEETPEGTTNAPTELALRNDLGWRFVPANYPHEWRLLGNLRAFDDALPIFDLAPHTNPGAYPRIESSANLITRTVSVGSGLSAEQAAELALAAQAAVGRERIDYAASTLTRYAADGVTPVQVWDLFDETGTPVTSTAQAIVERVPR